MLDIHSNWLYTYSSKSEGREEKTVEKKILHLLEGLVGDVQSIKTDLSNVKADVGSLKTDVGSLKAEVGNLNTKVDRLESEMTGVKIELTGVKGEMNGLKTDMHNRFDRVDHLLEGIGGQFEQQTDQRINEVKSLQKDILTIKTRIFDLETPRQ